MVSVLKIIFFFLEESVIVKLKTLKQTGLAGYEDSN
jgi:hypothetical protein